VDERTRRRAEQRLAADRRIGGRGGRAGADSKHQTSRRRRVPDGESESESVLVEAVDGRIEGWMDGE